MFTVDLEKELTQQNAKSHKDMRNDMLASHANNIFKEMDNAKDVKIFDTLGFKQFEEGVGVLKHRQKLYKRLEKMDITKVFTLEQIKGICIKYRLRFLPSNLYKGNIDPQLPSKVKEFVMLEGKSVEDYQYYICAPAESFELQARSKDPLLFAKLDEDHYYLIHKWGDDMSVSRAIFNFHRRTETHKFLFWFILLSIPVVLLGIFIDPSFFAFEIGVFLITGNIIADTWDASMDKWNDSEL